MPVVLLMHCDGPNGSSTFIDSSSYARTLISLGATLTTTSPKFGTASGNFTTSSNAPVDTQNAVDFNFGAGQFTVEAWGYFTATPSGVQSVASQWASSTPLGWFFGMSSGQLSFYYSTTGSDNPVVQAAYSPTLNTWIHLAVDRDASNVLRVYANGVVIASGTVAVTIFASTQTCYIGGDRLLGRGFPGRLDEVRITTGLAQYGAPFTPPTGPFGGAAVSAQGPRVMVLA